MARIFGPVRSRRLGLSLGIDLLPHKTCNLDCVYCECGATTEKTNTRALYTPTQGVLDEITAKVEAHTNAVREGSAQDEQLTLTFAGAGEPTLHSAFGDIARQVKKRYPDMRLTLITNGLLFNDPGVRREAGVFDLVLPSLDAALQKTFLAINRPLAGYTAEGLIEGLAAFRSEYEKIIWLEIFIIPGINDHPDELALLKKAILRIQPDLVQINSLDRPGTDKNLTAASRHDLEAVAKFFFQKDDDQKIGCTQNIEIISRAPLS